jgi:hypothetical protein
MNNPAIKRLAKELQEIQQFKGNDKNNYEEFSDKDENCIEAAPLKVKIGLKFNLHMY